MHLGQSYGPIWAPHMPIFLVSSPFGRQMWKMGLFAHHKYRPCCILVSNVIVYNYMNTLAPHLEMSPKRFTYTIVLFSTSELTYCAVGICDSEWATIFLHSMFWIFTEVVTRLFHFYMAGAMWNCCRYHTFSVYCTSVIIVHRCNNKCPQIMDNH